MVEGFYVDGFIIPHRLERNCNRGGVVIYLREGIPSKILEKHKLPQDIEGMFIEHCACWDIVHAGSVSRLLRVNQQSYELEILWLSIKFYLEQRTDKKNFVGQVHFAHWAFVGDRWNSSVIGDVPTGLGFCNLKKLFESNVRFSFTG